MVAAAAPLNTHVQVQPEAFVAADVGGTHARVALVRAALGGGRGIEVLAYHKYACADFASLSDVLKTFVESEAEQRVRVGVIACAGQVIGDAVVNDNLAWRVNVPRLRDRLDFDDVALLNDFEALGYALDDVGTGSVLVCGPETAGKGPALVVGPGTGLGAAVRLPGPAGAQVLTSEAGQMDFAPGTARERKVLAAFARDDVHVPYERILSGPGLLKLYTALSILSGQAPVLATPEAVTAAARAGSDAVAVETVEMFCEVLGAFVGNLALAFMADGGIYLAGGVLPEIGGLLHRSRFVERFMNKGGLREFLLRVPVRLIEHGRYGVVGAARWYLDRCVRGSERLRTASGETEA